MATEAAKESGGKKPEEEIAELRDALKKAEEARNQMTESTTGILKQLQARSEKLIASETELEKLRNHLRKVTQDVPGYLKNRVAKAEHYRKLADQEVRRLQGVLQGKVRELEVLEGLVGTYQTQLAGMASSMAATEADGEELAAAAGQQVVEEVYENQRMYRLIGWSPKLLGTDRAPFSDRSGEQPRLKESVKLPADWSWLDEWHVEAVDGEAVDGDGWSYAFDFPKFEDAGAGRSEPAVDDCVRRRRWVRTRMQTSHGSLGALGNALLQTAFREAQLKRENAALQAQLAAARAGAARAAEAVPDPSTSNNVSVPATGAGGGAGAGAVAATPAEPESQPVKPPTPPPPSESPKAAAQPEVEAPTAPAPAAAAAAPVSPVKASSPKRASPPSSPASDSTAPAAKGGKGGGSSKAGHERKSSKGSTGSGGGGGGKKKRRAKRRVASIE